MLLKTAEPSPYNFYKLRNKKEVIIGNNVCIGSKVISLKGTKIGDNSIIAAGSVVTGKIFPANVIIRGNLAKVIKYIDFENKRIN